MTHWARCLFLLLLRAAGSGRLQRLQVTHYSPIVPPSLPCKLVAHDVEYPRYEAMHPARQDQRRHGTNIASGHVYGDRSTAGSAWTLMTNVSRLDRGGASSSET